MLVVFSATPVITIEREAPGHVDVRALHNVDISSAGNTQTERESRLGSVCQVRVT